MWAMDADALYGLPLERFVAERNALAKSLRAEGRRDEAATVTALRKPSLAAWAVNQLARTQRAAMDQLFAAGETLRAAQTELLAGAGERERLRSGLTKERAAVDALVAIAEGLLSMDGHALSPAVLERVGETLHAGALDQDAREQVRGGRLERELSHAGLGVAPGQAPARGKRAAAPKAEPKPPPGPDRKALRLAEVDARRNAERTQRALRTAQQRRDRAADAFEVAQAQFHAAEHDAQEAAAAHERARAALEAAG